MAYDSPKAASLKLFDEDGDRFLGGLSILLRWNVAKYLKLHGVDNLLSSEQRTRSRHLLENLPDHLTNGGQYRFELDYPLD